MSLFDNLSKQLSEVTVYDIKSYYNQAKNVVMNYTEMEAKVREATNNDPWGTSSSLMDEIARATSNFQLFNEIMPTIYKRFTEKEASEWRQIYKALQLLEFLVKNGSERVIDDARSHLSIIKILRSFHYIDDKGKDQGINVRNRSKELAELLSDSDRIRMERRKARANKQKYKGFEGGSGIGSSGFSSGSMSTGGRYGGFGSESGGYGGESVSDFYRTGGGAPASSTRRDSFEEYDAGDWDDRTAGGSSSAGASRGATRPSSSAAASKPAPPPKKEVNLFDMDDEEPPAAQPPKPTAAPAAPAPAGLDDDFDDFQTAAPAAASPPPPAAAPAAPTPAPAGASKPSFFDLMNAPSSGSTVPAAAAPAQPMRPAAQPMSSFSSMGSAPSQPAATPSSGFAPMAPSAQPAAPAKPSGAGGGGGGAFDDIWSMAGGSSSSGNKAGGKSMAELNKQKSDAQIWNSSGSMGGSSGGGGASGGDLLF